MKSKLQKVISSCVTLAQLRSAWNYVINHYVQYGCKKEYKEAVLLIEKRVTEMSGFHYQNYVDYKAYAEHLLLIGKITDVNDFIQLAEIEVNKLESFFNHD